MKRTLQLGVIVVLAAVIWMTYPRVGALVLAGGAGLEARLYGLEKRSIDIGDMEMVTYVGGPEDAETIVMIHGYTADKLVWARFAKSFTDDYHVIIPDLAGHGETRFDPAWDYSIPAQAERVSRLMDALGVEKAHLIGNSMGGYITGEFSIRYPDRTLSVGLSDAAGVKSPTPSTADLMRDNDGVNPFFVRSQEDFATLYPMTMARPPWLPGFVLDAVGQDYINRRESYMKIWEDFSASALLQDRLGQIRAPAMVLWGKEDQLVHVSAVEVFKSGIPHLQVFLIDGIGHMPMVEVPDESAAAYRKFLDTLKTQHINPAA